MNVELTDQEVANLHTMVTSFRNKLPEDDTVQTVLRSMELKLAGALRSNGWKPNPDGGWVQHGQRRGARF